MSNLLLKTLGNAVILAGLSLSSMVVFATATTELVSKASDGTQGNHNSFKPAINGDGRYITFYSAATNLVVGDTNDRDDIFVHDRQSGTTELVSKASDGTLGNNYSFFPAISGDGRYVTFYSLATNLVAGGTSGLWSVFVHDRQSGTTELVSKANDGTQGTHHSFKPAISGDGRYVTFYSRATNLVAGDTNNQEDIFVHDRQFGTTELVSKASDSTQGNSNSIRPVISGDGRYVAFYSRATNLVAGGTSSNWDIFVHDRQFGTTEQVSKASDGTQGNGHSYRPDISNDGRYVTFYSSSTNLVAGDTNNTWDIFVHDRQSGTTERVSKASDGTQGSNQSIYPAISGNGRYVTFYSNATNLVAGDTNNRQDIFVHDRQLGTTGLVSKASDGTQGNNDSLVPAISGDGRYVTFYSNATNLVAGDTNNSPDIFVHDRHTNTPPVLGALALPSAPVPQGTPVLLEASVSDVDTGDTLTAYVDWDDGSSSYYTPVLTDGHGMLSVTHSYAEPGIYTVNVTLEDAEGESDSGSYSYVVIYDPSAGFVTGGGWINSPLGAYTPDETLTGKANFGFVAKYRKGKIVPDGNTVFHFVAGDFNFHSTSYQWLVVSGPKGQFKGEGQINNAGNYGFLLTANDNAINGGGNIDTFRIKIWNKATNVVIYDNQLGESDDAAASTALGGGSIVIHVKKGK